MASSFSRQFSNRNLESQLMRPKLIKPEKIHPYLTFYLTSRLFQFLTFTTRIIYYYTNIIMNKNLKNVFNPLVLGVFFSVLVSCNDDDEPVAFDGPTVEFSSPTDLTALSATVASAQSFSLNVQADAGLSKVSVNVDGTETEIASFSAGETSADVNYDFSPILDYQTTHELFFTVEDSEGSTTNSETYEISAVGELGYLLVDFASASTASSTIDNGVWDMRTKYSLSVTGSLTSNATVEVVANQARLEFGQTGLDSSDPLLKFIKLPAAKLKAEQELWTDTAFANVVIDLDRVIPEDIASKLATWDAAADKLTAGSKVLQMDVYYDTSADPSFGMTEITALEKNQWIDGIDPANGFYIEATLGSYESLSVNVNTGNYLAYGTYLTKTDEWVTVSFDQEVISLAANFEAEGAESAVSASDIDGLNIVPGRTLNYGNLNPIYFKNLRIVDAQ